MMTATTTMMMNVESCVLIGLLVTELSTRVSSVDDSIHFVYHMNYDMKNTLIFYLMNLPSRNR